MSDYFFKKKIDAVILCGGVGSRIKQISRGIPKSLLKINDKPFINYIFNITKNYNFEKIYLLTGYKSHLFDYLHKSKINFVDIECIKEKRVMGTGGALYNLKKRKINDFILLNGDSILKLNYLELIKTVKKTMGAMALTYNYNYKSNKKLSNLSLKNKKIIFNKKGRFMNAGVYFFKKKILRKIQNKYQSLENDILPNLIKKKQISGLINRDFFIDIGTPNNFKKAKKKIFNKFYKPAVFLDRDGVINYDYGYVNNYKDFKLRPGVIKGLKLLQDSEYLLFVVTNQAGIAKKIFSEKDFLNLHLKIKKKFLKKNIIINDVMYCPHHPNGISIKYKKNCNCRKPKNGMIKKLFKNYDVNKNKSFMIGDKKSDEICSKKSNLKFVYAQKNFYFQIKKFLRKSYV